MYMDSPISSQHYNISHIPRTNTGWIESWSKRKGLGADLVRKYEDSETKICLPQTKNRAVTMNTATMMAMNTATVVAMNTTTGEVVVSDGGLERNDGERR
ncbi:hypothetical protein MTR_4g040440 [Medicago truncatula]|uniref:Uncharacterized protein n=1 Tax=Medicago truncatula TaxID=3880 RepID=A0A072UJB4_MEDTR|nr:hypothetical protein MTR_4g040440 [Medicago truncatula]